MTTTLQTYLPAELDLIDAEEADGVTLADVDNAAYLEFESEAALVEHALAITINPDDGGTETIALTSISHTPGNVHAEHAITVAVHLKDVENETPEVTKRRVMRYARAVERVLAVKYPTMPDAGAETVFSVSRLGAGPMRYRLNEEQAEGQHVRSAVIPFLVTTYESA